MSNFFKSMDISASAMTGQRFVMDVISQNIANADTTMDPATGEVYKRQIAMLKPVDGGSGFRTASFGSQLASAVGGGVEIAGTMDDNSDLRKIYDPGNPAADETGYVYKPNVNIIQEMADMMAANRAYQANVTSIETAKQMAMKSLEILKGM